jgi:DNA-3-methyladenine glycosylase I
MTESAQGGVVIGADGLARCPWAGSSADYMAYHDTEWGVPIHDEHALYERLMLEAFQSGLAWITILRKREGIRDAFCQFDPEKVAAFTEEDIERLMGDPRIIRNRQKINAAIRNAQATIGLRALGGLDSLIWRHQPETIPAPVTLYDIPTYTSDSIALAKALKKAGFMFVGPTTAYAMMQAIGMVNDHLRDCVAR